MNNDYQQDIDLTQILSLQFTGDIFIHNILILIVISVVLINSFQEFLLHAALGHDLPLYRRAQQFMVTFVH